MARHGAAWRGKAWAANAAGWRLCRLPGVFHTDVACRGEVWRGEASPGPAGLGKARVDLDGLPIFGWVFRRNRRHYMARFEMRQLKVKVKGLSPLLMHSDRFANPLDKATKAHKELTSKRKKTDADHEAIAKSEWLGSLYWAAGIGPYIPGQNLDASLQEAARLQKLGRKFKQAVTVIENEPPLIYKGPRDPEGLFAAGFLDVRGVKVSMAKVMRCRPKFNDWACEFTVAYNEDVLNVEDLKKAIHDAGALVGVCDYRPRYGKFTAEVQ